MSLEGRRMKRSQIRVYQARDGYRWSLIASNGRIVADSGEAYVHRANATRAARALSAIAGHAVIRFDDTPPRQWETP